MKKVKIDIAVVVGGNIRKLRISQELSQSQLAYETGLTREFINRVENGNNNISIKKLALIADALDIQPKKLFE
ncbi:MAG: helix-turn-helix transcriptional regulator [Bacteroidia bacterium]